MKKRFAFERFILAVVIPVIVATVSTYFMGAFVMLDFGWIAIVSDGGRAVSIVIFMAVYFISILVIDWVTW